MSPSGARPMARSGARNHWLRFHKSFIPARIRLCWIFPTGPMSSILRAKWQVNRWGKGDLKPLFTVYLFVQEMAAQMAGVGV